MTYGEQAFKRFFKGLTAFPVFKKKGKNELGAYFVKNNKTDFEFYRHKIKIPTLKFVRVKEYGYIPKNVNIKSGTISKIADRYFLSLVIEIENTTKITNTSTKGLGIDLGIKDTAICSDGRVFKNTNKTIGVERFIYNEYIKYNQEQYKLGNKFVSANDFSKYLNNIYLSNNLDKKWIKDVSSKSVKQAIIYGERAFKNFFKGLSSFPVFKKKDKNELGAYFVKNNKTDFEF